MALGTTAIGKFLDWRYQFEKKQLQERLIREGELEKRLEVEKVKDVDKLSEFPLERVRFLLVCSSYFFFFLIHDHFDKGSSQVSFRISDCVSRMYGRIWLVYTQSS